MLCKFGHANLKIWRERNPCTPTSDRLHLSRENLSPHDPPVGLRLWPYGGPGGGMISHERGAPVQGRWLASSALALESLTRTLQGYLA